MSARRRDGRGPVAGVAEMSHADAGFYSRIKPTVDEDAREAYTAFLSGAPLPGREQG